MTDFNAWLSFAIGDDETKPGGEEGGLSWDTGADNPTWRGVQYNEFCKWKGVPTLGMPFSYFTAQCTRAVIGQIAGSQYWDKFHVDLLPSGPNMLYMDGCFNGGGVANLQSTMNTLFSARLAVDGDLGPKTLAAMDGLADVPPGALIDRYVAAADARYIHLAQQDRFAGFLDGWRHRLRRCEDLALNLADNKPPSAAGG